MPALAGKQIPVFSRIASVCDVFDAATTKRCYSEAKPPVQALWEMEHQHAGAFDPVVEAALRTVVPAFPIGSVVTLSDHSEAVVVGFDTTLEFNSLCQCAWWIKQGKVFIATHPDQVCPTNLPTVLVDCGAVCAALESATGRQPDAVPGKPDPRMLQGILRRHGLEPEQMAMVGDRIYTDIAMAHNAGSIGVLVLTGEATAKDAEVADRPPHFVMESIEVLGQRLADAQG